MLTTAEYIAKGEEYKEKKKNGTNWHMFISYKDEYGRVQTRPTDVVTEENIQNIKRNEGFINSLYEEAKRILSLDVSKMYTTYYKKKTSGGKRRVDIPDEYLKYYMRSVKHVFVDLLNFVFPRSQYAYIKGRSCKDMVKVHKSANVIMHFDITDFFGSCTLEFIMNSMQKIYPFCLIDPVIIETILKACMVYYNGHFRLPQGAPSSPFLSNIAMIPIDYMLSKTRLNHTVYTRYSDDIYISFLEDFRPNSHTKNNVYSNLEYQLSTNNPEFKINDKKSKIIYINKSNGMWITGLMLNKEHNITIGHKKKQMLKASIFSFLMDCKNGKPWSKEEVYKLVGNVGYCKFIEPSYVDMIISKYEQKTSMCYNDLVKNILNS